MFCPECGIELFKANIKNDCKYNHVEEIYSINFKEKKAQNRSFLRFFALTSGNYRA